MFDPKEMIDVIANASEVPDMTLQQVFDVVATHLFMQGKKSEDYHGACVYRGENGTKCAVGVLIPDEIYQSKWDVSCLPVDAIIKQEANNLQPLVRHRALLERLQRIHDYNNYWRASENMQIALSGLARDFGLRTDSIFKLKFAGRHL